MVSRAADAEAGSALVICEPERVHCHSPTLLPVALVLGLALLQGVFARLAPRDVLADRYTGSSEELPYCRSSNERADREDLGFPRPSPKARSYVQAGSYANTGDSLGSGLPFG